MAEDVGNISIPVESLHDTEVEAYIRVVGEV